jgi:hypothetical protein
MVDWSRPFDQPIVLPKGKTLVTLKDAANYILKLPKSKQHSPEWRVAGCGTAQSAQADGEACSAAGNAQADAPGVIAGRCRHKKAPDDAGAFEMLKFSGDQYFATTGPPQLKR